MSQTRSNEKLLSDIRKGCLGTYRSQPGRLDGDIGNESENQSNYHGRFIYELLQNADDVLDDRDTQLARFELHENRLFMAHTGAPFTEEDVRALCILGLSSKSDEHATIGQKGRGFTSVLEITETPAAYSTTHDFHFDRQKAYETIGSNLSLDRQLEPSDVPVLTMPFAPESRPRRVQELLSDESPFTTVFEFELKEGRRETIKQRLADLDPHTILFLRNLARLEIEIDGDELAWNLTRSSVTTESRIATSQLDIHCEGSEVEWGPGTEQYHYIKFREEDIPVTHRNGLEGPHWEAVEYTEIGIALQYREEDDGVHLEPFDRPPDIHVFLPTEEPSPFPLLVNGAFKPDSSRTGIPIVDVENGYNAFLLREVAELVSTAVLEYAAKTATTVDEFLDCIAHRRGELSSEAAAHLADAVADTLGDVAFLPSVDDDLACRVGPDRHAPRDLILPYSHEDGRWIGERIADVYGPGSLPSRIDPQERRFPAVALLDEAGHRTLRSLGLDQITPSELPALLADAPAHRGEIRSFEDVGARRKVDPVLDILLGVVSVISDEETRAGLLEACTTEAVFPVAVDEAGGINRVETDGVNLLFPPEDFGQTLGLDGVQFMAPQVYRPAGWTRPRGEHGDADEFRSQVQSLWEIDRFDFQSFAQAVILPRLPRSRRPVGDVTDLESVSHLRVLRELASESVDPSTPLPHEPRKKQDLYRLCMLPVPTKRAGWRPAYEVYFGEAWLDDSASDHASPLSIFDACHGVDPPVLVDPEELAAPDDGTKETESTAGDPSDRDRWFAFFQWLGVAPHLRLTPLFDPRFEREYSATADLGRPSERHPTLGALPQSTWDRFRSQLLDAVESSAASDRDNRSIYRANRIEFWPVIQDAARERSDVAVDLFCHLAEWWEERFAEATAVGVGGHSVTASQVSNRDKGIPSSTERYPLGKNLWLWELRESDWCPTIHDRQYRPTRVWGRSQSLIDQFTIDDGGTVLLPILHDRIEEKLGGPPDAVCRALGIRATMASGDFKPPDARLSLELLADWAEEVTDRDIQTNLPTLRTAYREIAFVMPSRRRTRIPTEWQDARRELESTRVICQADSGDFELHDARDAFYVTSRGERRQVPLSDPPIFILKENEAGAFGQYFGMRSLVDATQTDPQPGERDDETTRKGRSFLQERTDALRCLLARDRPARRRDDADDLERFIDELEFVETLEVEYRLDEFESVSEPPWFIETPEKAGARRTPFISSPSEGDLEDVLDTVAKTLCEFLNYPNIGDVILVLRTRSARERNEKLDLLDAPRELLDTPGHQTESSRVTLGLGSVDVTDSSMTSEAAPLGQHSRESSTSEAVDAEGGDGQATTVDPAERLWDPDELVIALDDGTTVESTGFPARASRPSVGIGSGSGSSTVDQRSNPAAGGIREAINEHGSEIAYNYECARLQAATGVEDPSDYVFYVEDRSQIQRARKHLGAQPVLRWLTEEVGLDWTYPGFDILSVHPDSEAGEPKIERLIEVKSLMDDGAVSVSLNEWHTANLESVQSDYYLYVVADLSVESSGYPFVRTIQNPAAILEANPKEQRSISLELNTKRFSEEGTVREFPLREIDT